MLIFSRSIARRSTHALRGPTHFDCWPSVRLHNEADFQKIRDAAKFLPPILLGKQRTVISGFGPAEIINHHARRQKIVAFTVRFQALKKGELHAYVEKLKDAARRAGWSDEMLAIELQLLDEKLAIRRRGKGKPVGTLEGFVRSLIMNKVAGSEMPRIR